MFILLGALKRIFIVNVALSCFILGSCGLEYTIDYTEAGKRQNSYGGSYSHNSYVSKRSDIGGSWIWFVIIVGLVVLVIYKMGGNGAPQHDHPAPPPPPSHHRPSSWDRHGGSGGNSPPPYGFKPEYTETSTESILLVFVFTHCHNCLVLCAAKLVGLVFFATSLRVFFHAITINTFKAYTVASST